ncbi:uncharacterized protein FIBRA_05696 [Fibroporia radiculosa]|uniref:DNA mismatch repair proteins mutS family domain-containing protein n=1 Tax=Fibroporia radiculosa TaxID=599839 RepID=J4GRG4_9APHY|nr:uncharacterized protein FIBRA_05696 [Fibroporia radiculosa]CCM03560.1 predicted protein [Fibroporia radiculosa]
MPRQKHAPISRSQTNAKRRRVGTEEDVQPGGIEDSLNSSTSRKKVRWGGDLESSLEPSELSSEGGDNEGDIMDKLHHASCCAYYDPVKCTIFAFEDMQENQHYDLAKALFEQCSPNIAITSSKADENFIDVLRDHLDASGGIFQIRPHKDFSPVKGRDRILSLRLLSELPMDAVHDFGSSDSDYTSAPNAYDFMRRRKDIGGDPTLQRWNASIRLSNFASVDGAPLCLGSIGALLDYLARVRAVEDLENDGIGGLEIRAIETLVLSQAMQINADALHSLQIFEEENHASIHSDKTKEGLSLFGIINHTKTSLGRALLREWFLRPSLSPSVIAARHDAVACFMRPDNLAIIDSMHGSLKGIKNIPRMLGTLRTGKARLSDWQGIMKFTVHSLMLREALVGLHQANDIEIVKKLLDTLDTVTFRDIGNTINGTIDWEESANSGRICVKLHVDEELDKLKHIYHGIDAVLSKVAQQISVTVPPDYASSLNVVYFPQLGFLVCVPLLEEWTAGDGIKVLDGWTFQFSSESHVYFKSQEMHDMDTHIGDLHPSIVDREIEIVQSLSERIMASNVVMSHACDVCAELDCLLSFAEASRAYNFTRPQISEQNVIHIKQGRHPLQELVVDTFVPNDAFVVGGAGINAAAEGYIDQNESEKGNSIIVCTGANACGKSVYLKQVALIQYMAQIGCFVPADSATLGIVDKIFTRIQTRESVSRVQSAFMIDLNQVSLALRSATARSLILLDEFGKGTLSAGSYRTYGAGLFCAVLKHLAMRGSGCPKVFAATHFHDVFTDDLLSSRSLPITFVHMQIMLTTSRGHLVTASGLSADEDPSDTDDGSDSVQAGSRRIAPGERITYLYRVANGLSLNSHAALCAEVSGIPRRVTKRAQYVSNLLSSHELGRLLDEDMTEDEQKDLENAEDVCRQFLAWDLTMDRDHYDGIGDVKRMLADVLGP